MPSLVILVSVILILSCLETDRQTDRETDRITETDQHYIHLTTVSMSNNYSVNENKQISLARTLQTRQKRKAYLLSHTAISWEHYCYTGDKLNVLLVIIVRLRHCSSISPCALPDSVNGVSYINRRILLLRSKSVCLSRSSFSSKYGVTCVTWM